MKTKQLDKALKYFNGGFSFFRLYLDNNSLAYTPTGQPNFDKLKNEILMNCVSMARSTEQLTAYLEILYFDKIGYQYALFQFLDNEFLKQGRDGSAPVVDMVSYYVEPLKALCIFLVHQFRQYLKRYAVLYTDLTLSNYTLPPDAVFTGSRYQDQQPEALPRHQPEIAVARARAPQFTDQAKQAICSALQPYLRPDDAEVLPQVLEGMPPENPLKIAGVAAKSVCYLFQSAYKGEQIDGITKEGLADWILRVFVFQDSVKRETVIHYLKPSQTPAKANKIKKK